MIYLKYYHRVPLFLFCSRRYLQFYTVLSQEENAIHLCNSLHFFLCPSFFSAARPLAHFLLLLTSSQFSSMALFHHSVFTTILLDHGGLCVLQYISHPYPYRWSTVPQNYSMCFYTTGSWPLPEQARKSWEVAKQWPTIPDSPKSTLTALSVSTCFLSVSACKNSVSLCLGDLISMCSTVKMGQHVCLLNLVVPTFLQQVHIAFPVATLKGSLTSLCESLCASSVFMMVNSA